MPPESASAGSDRWLLRVAHDHLGWREASASRRCSACAGERRCWLGRDGRAVWCATVSDRGLFLEIVEAIERRLEAFERGVAREEDTHAS